MGQVPLCPVECVREVVGGVTGVDQLRGCSGDVVAGVGVVVGADSVGVVFGVESVSELVELPEPALDKQDELPDKSVELDRPDKRVRPAGAVVRLVIALGGGLGEVVEAGRMDNT